MRVREQVERYIDRLQSLAKAIATVVCFRVWQLQQRLIIMFVLCSMMSIVLLLIKVVMRWLRRLWAFRNTFQTRLPLTVRPMFSSSQDPNMSGKSTYMRQLALSVVMAQMGSYVPADSIDLPVLTPSIHVLVLQMT